MFWIFFWLSPIFVVLGPWGMDDSGSRSDLGLLPIRESEKQSFERLLKRYHQVAYRQHHANGPDLGPFRPGIPIEARAAADRAEIPDPVLTAHDFYLEGVERHDWGSVRLFKTASLVMVRPVWIVWVTTDGDDGWVELFDSSGLPLGAGRTYLELVGWAPAEDVRSFVWTGGFPHSLTDRAIRTLWAKQP